MWEVVAPFHVAMSSIPHEEKCLKYLSMIASWIKA